MPFFSTHHSRGLVRASLILTTTAAFLAGSALQAQSYSVLYSFRCGPADGATPVSGLIADSKGNLYGTTAAGGESASGTVFELSPDGEETVLHSFAGPPSDGQGPAYTVLLRDSAGNLYGTTPNGGLTDHGTVYKLTPAGIETVLHSFGATGGDGWLPYGGLILDAKGDLYGTTDEGGEGYGTVFEVFMSGVEFPLHRFLGFQEGDGDEPVGGVLRDPMGDLYGTTYEGGLYDGGTVFKLNKAGQERAIYSFRGGNDGSGPFAGLTLGPAGNFFGTTQVGGPSNDGTVFEVTPAGKEHVLYSFKGMPDGALPYAGLVRDQAGNLYGTAAVGGSDACNDGIQPGCGVIFEVRSSGKETLLHTFTGTPDGDGPYGALLMDSAGNFYGTTAAGGAYGCGTVFEYTP